MISAALVFNLMKLAVSTKEGEEGRGSDLGHDDVSIREGGMLAPRRSMTEQNTAFPPPILRIVSKVGARIIDFVVV